MTASKTQGSWKSSTGIYATKVRGKLSSPYELERFIIAERNVNVEKTRKIEYQVYEQVMKKLSLCFVGHREGLEKQFLSEL